VKFTITFCKLNSVNPLRFSESSQSHLSDINDHTSPPDILVKYNTSISTALDILAPLISRSWFTTTLCNMKTAGRCLERLYRKTCDCFTVHLMLLRTIFNYTNLY